MGLFHNAEDWLKHFGREILEKIEDLFDSIEQLPIDRAELPNIPALPVSLWELPDTLIKLEHRSVATTQAKTGLSNVYTIQGYTYNGYSFLYDEGRKLERRKRKETLKTEVQVLRLIKVDKLIKHINLEDRLGKHGSTDEMPMGTEINLLALDHPDQFSISWTTFYNIYNGAQSYLPRWSGALQNTKIATEEFWPTIARYGMAYNLLVLQNVRKTKVEACQLQSIKEKFGEVWDRTWDKLHTDGLLYVIDMSLFECQSAKVVRGAERFTPATITLLSQDKKTKALTPIAVRVCGAGGADVQIFTQANSTPFAWIYALQAARTSITVWGIWIGHVYHWHIITAALQMTFYNSLDKDHPLYAMLAPQCDYLIPFNDALLLLWSSIAPPTSIDTAYGFLELINVFAEGRGYYEDDPRVTIDIFGIEVADFTTKENWDQYPIVGHHLHVWDATEAYVDACVKDLYKTNKAVAEDEDLQDWITAAGDPDIGNVQGIGAINTRADLAAFLTSMVYRITVHGCARLMPSANPALSFIPNFPPCLQSSKIPSPVDALTLTDILDYMPKTGTIGEMMTFYNTFAFSAPYKPFLPLGGNDDELFFDAQQTGANQALIDFRNTVEQFITTYTAAIQQPESIAQAPQHFQWPLNIET